MLAIGQELGISYAFVERNFRAVRRYWGWELVWLIFAIVNALTVAYIAPGGQLVSGETFATERLILFLIVGTVVWAYLQQVFDAVAFMISWERWEGTIESTFMAPARRLSMILGSSVFAITYAFVRSIVVLGVVSLFFDLDLSRTNWGAAFVVLAVGSAGFLGVAIMASSLPLLFLERGDQMTVVVLSAFSPATYVLDGMRGAVLDGSGLGELAPLFLPLGVIAVVSLPLGVWVFRQAEQYALRTGRLKRSG